jgi:predicted nucleic acid-binding protein
LKWRRSPAVAHLGDAISFAAIETRRIGTAFSFDRHFLAFGRWREPGVAP